jgi:hypothetical protein
MAGSDRTLTALDMENNAYLRDIKEKRVEFGDKVGQ